MTNKLRWGVSLFSAEFFCSFMCVAVCSLSLESVALLSPALPGLFVRNTLEHCRTTLLKWWSEFKEWCLKWAQHAQLWPVLWYSGAQNPFKEEPVSLHAWLGTSLRDKFAPCLHLSSLICNILTWGSCDSSSILCYSSWTSWAISVKLFRGMDIKIYLNFCMFSEEGWGDQRGCKKGFHYGKIENVPVPCL